MPVRRGARRFRIMAKKLAQRTARRKREHLVDQDEKIIPINHETVEIIA